MFEAPVAHYCEISSPHSQILSKSLETENCLRNCYHIDQQSLQKIMFYFRSLLENVDYHEIINDFIQKSNALNISFSKEKKETPLQLDDAVLNAPKWHEVIFESPYVRILWADSLPGDKEPSHIHYWKSLMVITQAGTYEIVNSDGSIERDLWPIGVYELPAETSSAAYTNIGSTQFKALRFEIKD